MISRLLLLSLITLFMSCSKTESINPERKDIIDVVFASGNISNSDSYTITSNTEGFLNDIYVKEGDAVRMNTELFSLSSDVQNANLNTAEINYSDAQFKARKDSPQMIQLKTEISQAEMQLSIDQKNYQRYQKLIETNAISQVEFEKTKLQYQGSKNNLSILKSSLKDLENSVEVNLKNSKNQLTIQQENSADYLIRSKENGTVLSIYKEKGDLIKRGESIGKIGAGNTVIVLYVAEEDINSIRLNQEVKVALNTYSDSTFDARVSKIYPAFDLQEQSFMVEAQFVQAPERLFDGTQLQANIIIAKKQNALVIPSEYISGSNTVMVNGDATQITIGLKTNDWTEVLEGLSESSSIQLPKK